MANEFVGSRGTEEDPIFTEQRQLATGISGSNNNKVLQVIRKRIYVDNITAKKNASKTY